LGSKQNLEGKIAFIGIGANLGDPAANCREAILRINAIDGIRILRHSLLYKTQPVGLDSQPWFANAAAEIRTTLSPWDLLLALKNVERNMGRQESVHWGPRVIDLDILFYGQEVISEDKLKIPHPELHRRRFVLAPLDEIASYVIHPLYGISVRGLYERLENDHVAEIIGD